jgi:hypothetical protein
VNFNTMVAPLAAPSQGGPESNVGSGLLIQVASQIYLVTVAHLATGQVSQSDDWSLWADEVRYHGPDEEILATMSLFDVSAEGTRIPRFKYFRVADKPGLLLDIILLPLSPDDPMSSMSLTNFDLPNDIAPHILGETLTMVGCRPWPVIGTETHVLKLVAAVLHVYPQQEKGYSGCPVVNSAGLLAGMAFGGDLPGAPDHGLLVAAEIIHELTTAVDGVCPASP